MRPAQIGARADGQIVFPAAKIAEQAQLHRSSIAGRFDFAAVVQGLRVGAAREDARTAVSNDSPADVVDIAAEIVVRITTKVDVSRQQLVGFQEMAGLGVQEGDLVFVAIRPRVRLLARIQPAQRQRLRAFKLVVGQHQRNIDVRVFAFPAHLAEHRLQPTRRVVAPAVFIQKIAGQKQVRLLAVRAILDLSGFPAP